MVQVADRVYGPGPIRGSRVQLAAPGVEYTRAQIEAIRSSAITPVVLVGDRSVAPVVPAEPEPVAVEHEVVEQPDLEDVVVGDAGPTVEELQVDAQLEVLGGGWYRLPDGTRIRGKDEAERALLEQQGQ